MHLQNSTPAYTRGSSTVAFCNLLRLRLFTGARALLLGSIITLAVDAAPTLAKTAQGAGLPRSSAGKILKTIEDLPNFHAVHPFLYRSGEPTEAGLLTARDKYNIQTIVDLRGSPKYTDVEKAQAKQLGMTYINLPMSSRPPTKAQVTTMMEAIRKARDGKTPGAVLVHCAHGSDRTGCMIGIWRVIEDNYTYDQAYAEMRKYWFTPKFTQLSGAVKEAAESSR
jgi:protein tyrosine/serine phosphatase